MRIVSIVGARPQFVKLAPICRAVDRRNRTHAEQIQHVIVHTGQHYDPELSDVFFEELEIPRADVNLGVGSGPHGRQTGRMLEQFENFVLESKPDALIVYGDTNSTIAGALVGVKQQVLVAHVESGLRSFNRLMPEEINRIATDHVSDVLYGPTPSSMRLLEAEGLASRSVLSGDVNYDALLQNVELARRKSKVVSTMGLKPGGYAVMTVHRSENTDAGRLLRLIESLGRLTGPGFEIVFPIHPRTVPLLPLPPDEFSRVARMRIVKPLGFLDMLALIDSSSMVLTDSGGLQKEAFFLAKPCITLRTETEWTETVELGGNVLTEMDPVRVVEAIEHWRRALAVGPLDFASRAYEAFGDGHAADFIIGHLFEFVRARCGQCG
jgi:UDP-N-acetylglucosamine 2-epimerase